MHARDLVELAALVTSQGPRLVSSGAIIPDGLIQRYWAASRTRLDYWGKRLKTLTRSSSSGDKLNLLSAGATIEEIVLSEALARTWTAVLHLYDDALGVRDAEPIARAALLGHLDIRNRALAMLVDNAAVNTETAVALNRLRRRVERWIDCLLGFLMQHGDVTHLAIEADRARDFAEDLQHQLARPGGSQVWPLTVAALRNAFQVGVHGNAVSPEHNQRLAETVISCLPADAFDVMDGYRSLWLVRLMNTANSAHGMVQSLLAEA